MSVSLPIPNPTDACPATEGDSIPEKPQHWRPEAFIPIRKAELVALLAGQPDVPVDERGAFERLCRLIEATFHYEFHARLEELKSAYAPFDPDADTQAIETLDHGQRQARVAELFDQFTRLLERANFVRLGRADIEAAVGAMSDWGLRLDIDFAVFDRLEVFARGDIVGRRTRRRWRNFNRDEEVEVPIYQRLVIIFRLRKHRRLEKGVDTEAVCIKIFKNIPKMDVDMLLPGARFRMNLIDQSKIFFPTVSGVAITGWKIFQGALVVAFSGVYGMLAFLGLVAGTLGYALRSFFGYLRTQQTYQLSLTRSLYYQNLDSNAGVLFRLLDEAEEQECREAVLAYFLLWRRAGADGWTVDELDRAAEQFLRQMLEVGVDFEIHDALDKLRRLGLVEEVPGSRLRAAPPAVALTRLDRSWDNIFT